MHTSYSSCSCILIFVNFPSLSQATQLPGPSESCVSKPWHLGPFWTLLVPAAKLILGLLITQAVHDYEPYLLLNALRNVGAKSHLTISNARSQMGASLGTSEKGNSPANGELVSLLSRLLASREDSKALSP